MTSQTGGPTLEQLRERRAEIEHLAAGRGARNVRVVGSVARNEARPDSDVDFLVDFDPGRTVVDLSGLILDLEQALDRKVDVLEIRQRTPLADSIEQQAVSL